MHLRFNFEDRCGRRVPVALHVHSPKRVESHDMWACKIAWSGLELAGKCGFGADPLGAVENTLSIVRSVLEMEAEDWKITPLIVRSSVSR